MPSMSTDIQTFTQPTIAGPTTMPDPSPRRFGGERSARLALVGRQDAVGDGRRGEPVRHPELAQDVRDVERRRPLRDVERGRDLTVGATRGEQAENLDLTRCQAELAQLVALGSTSGGALGWVVARSRYVDTGPQGELLDVPLERLGLEGDDRLERGPQRAAGGGPIAIAAGEMRVGQPISRVGRVEGHLQPLEAG